MRKAISVLGLVAAIGLSTLPARASLTTFATFSGNVSYSSDGMATLTGSGIVSANVPVGATVLAAYLYTAAYSSFDGSGLGGTINGTPVAYGAYTLNTGVCCNLGMKRADVTSVVKPIIDGGLGGIYDFTVTEDSALQEGEALIVVYSLASLPTSTVAILDGFSASGGDSFTASFADPLDTTAPGFFAEMALGINFSCCNQKSTVKVNGTTITDNAGNFDDDVDGGGAANGRLFTMGGFDDPYSALLPSYADDHERYDISDYITDGDTSILVETNNPSNDDNIFLAVFASSGNAIVVTPNDPPSAVPEPSFVWLLGAGLAALGWKARKRVAA